MSLAKKLGLGLLVIVGLMLVTVTAAVLSTARKPSRPVGAQQMLAADAGHQQIPVTIFYPTSSKPRWKWLGAAAVKVAPNGAIAGESLPVVIVSHGTAGSSVSHIDTALALAEAGYVVAAPLHTGDNLQDQSSVGTASWMVDRARHVSSVIDFMLVNWSGRAHLDPDKVGMFGFSAGATAGLIAIGGKPDFALVKAHCATRPEFVCRLLRPNTEPAPAAANWTHDKRIKAAVLVAPGFGFAFPANALSGVEAPVQLWTGTADQNVPPATNAAPVARMLPNKPQFHSVEGAGHFSFLPPCGLLSPLLPPMLCSDPGEFDRTAFHARFNRAIVEFFETELGDE